MRFIPTTLRSSLLEVLQAEKPPQSTVKDTSLLLILGKDYLNSARAASRHQCVSSTMEELSSALEVLSAKMPTCSTPSIALRD